MKKLNMAACRIVLGRMFMALPLAVSAPFAYAEYADKDKPLNIEADHMTYDDLRQTDVLTGNVVLTKGTILIKADYAEITQDPQGYQYATAHSNDGRLSYVRQKREGLDEYFEGTATHINYDGKQELTTLRSNATVRRLQGLSTLIDEIHGSVITHNGQNEFYTATSGRDAAGPGNPTGRVRAMLIPRNALLAPRISSPS